MGTMTDCDVDVFLARAITASGIIIAAEPLVWSSIGSSAYAVDAGGHAGERVFVPVNAVQTFPGVAYGGQGIEAVGLQGGGVVPQNVLKFQTAGLANICTLAGTIANALQLYNGNTLVATTANGYFSNSTYGTYEVFWGNVTPPVAEVRRNGVRIPELTTANFLASGGQPAGTLAQDAGHNMDAPKTAGTIARIILGDTSGGTTTSGIYWWYRKMGANPWVSITSGSDFASKSDFEGPKRRWSRAAAAIAHYARVNWGAGAGSFPSNIVDASGADGDNSYEQNSTAGTSVDADKMSYTLTGLPSGTTNVGIMRRVLIARQSGTTSTIRGGRRVGGVDTPDADFVLGSAFAAQKTAYLSEPDGSTVITAAAELLRELYVEQEALT